MSDGEEDDISMAAGANQDDSVLSRTPPSAKKQKKAPAAKKTGNQPLADLENEAPVSNAGGDAKSKTASERYQKAWLAPIMLHGDC